MEGDSKSNVKIIYNILTGYALFAISFKSRFTGTFVRTISVPADCIATAAMGVGSTLVYI